MFSKGILNVFYIHTKKFIQPFKSPYWLLHISDDVYTFLRNMYSSIFPFLSWNSNIQMHKMNQLLFKMAIVWISTRQEIHESASPIKMELYIKQFCIVCVLRKGMNSSKNYSCISGHHFYSRRWIFLNKNHDLHIYFSSFL